MPTRDTLGGIVHTYQRYDPARIPPPRPPEIDLVTPAMEHLLEFGDSSELTEEQLADAIVLSPEQIRGLGPSLESIRRRLEEARRKILETYETDAVRKRARQRFRDAAQRAQPPAKSREGFAKAVREEQIRSLERLWYAQDDDQSPFAGQLAGLIEVLGEVYQVDELAARWTFTGREKLAVPEALEVKERLEEIEELLRQIEEAMKTAKVALIDMEALGEYLEQGERDELDLLRRQIQEAVERLAAEQGLQKTKRGYELTPQALRLFQGKLLERIFADLDPSRTGRHQGDVQGEGAVETVPTRPYEFGDSVAHMDIPGSLVNAMLRQAGESPGAARPLRLDPRDIEVHRTRNTPKCATTVVMDMSGSMRYGGLHVSVKRMALALQGLVLREYPGDYVQFIEMASFAKPRSPGEIVSLMPKPVTVFDSVVRLRADMADPVISESDVPPHFTNIQHALSLSRQHLARQDTPNKQVILITDGLPTAHFEGSQLYLLYPPHRRTEEATMREAELCRREGIIVNVFLLSGWSQSRADIQFAYRLAEAAGGRVFFTAGKELERFVVWDYRARRRSVIG
ncbi:MAG: VWA domain-containing protein [Planctomycetota bacterium]|nr:MAG: VWA domain-containing protein [Planctomycetota bacterium]